MKIKGFPLIIAIAISALMVYGFYAASNNIVYCVGGLVCSLVTLISAMGISFDNNGNNTNFKILAYIFFVVLIVFGIIAAVFKMSNPSYIIVSGILLLIFVGIEYSIAKAEV